MRQWAMLALIWITAALVLGIFFWEERKSIQTSETARLQHQAQVIHDNLHLQIESISNVLQTLTQDIALAPVAPAETSQFNSRLRAFSDALIGVRTLLILDKDGAIVSANRPGLKGMDLSHREYIQKALHASKSDEHILFVSPPFKTVLGVWTIALTQVAFNPQGELAGLAVAILDPNAFGTLLNSVRYAPDVVSTLSHEDGLHFLTVAARSGASDTTLPTQSNELIDELLEGRLETTGSGPATSPQVIVTQRFDPPELRMNKALITQMSRSREGMLTAWNSTALLISALWVLAGVAAGTSLGIAQHRRRQFLKLEKELAHETAAWQTRWEAALTATQQGVWDCDVQTGSVYFSAFWNSMLGYGPNARRATIADWQALLHPDDHATVQAKLQKHLRGDTKVYESVHRMRCHNGEYKWVRDRGQVIEWDNERNPRRMMGTQIDVNAQQEQQETLNRLADNVPGALYQYQLDADGNAHFTYMSRGIVAIYGREPHELCADASLIFNAIHPEDLPALYESIQASATSLEVWRHEYRVVRPEGVHWISGQAMPQKNSAGDVLWYSYIQDITQAKEQTIQLQNTERLLQHLLQEMPVGLCMVNGAGEMYFRNRRFHDMFGYTQEEVPTLQEWRLKAYPDPAYRAEVIKNWTAALEHARAHQGEIQAKEYYVTDSHGRNRIMAISGVAFGDQFLATFVDRTEQQMQREIFRKLAFFDSLTELPNRRQFDHSLKAEWRRCRRSGKPLSLIMFDIDHFKQYNDLYGHQQGDECLRTVAHTLREGLQRPHDLVARYGGEEFVCVLPECDLRGALIKAEQICRAVQDKAIAHAGSSVAQVVTVSAGAACLVPGKDMEPSILIGHADANLYKAKAQGRNRVVGEDFPQPCKS